jgi:hypothetical protein
VTTDLQIYRYLRFKHKFVRGTVLCRNLRLPLTRLKALNDVRGVGSFGPCTRRELPPVRYAKYNGFCADFIAFFELGGKYLVRKERPLREGCRSPKWHRPKRRED